MFVRVAIALFFALATPGLARADALGDVRSAQAEVTRLDSERAQLDGRRVRLEHESQELAAEIEHQKAEPAGVRHDLKLQELLAASQAKTSDLDKVAGDLRGRSQSLLAARRALMGACDRALSGSLPEARRLELARLRTAQATLLAMPPQPLGIGKPAPSIDPLDGPRELQEKADLLRDSEDKLRREVDRLASRIDDAERRRHLRERAGAVDEDWFGESTSNRHVARAPGHSEGTTQNAGNKNNGDTASPAAPATGGTGGAGAGAGAPTPSPGGGGATLGGGGTGSNGAPPPSNNNGSSGFANDPGASRGSDTTTVLRNLVDPATLDELRRADGSDDLERQVRALRRAQGELQGLANDLSRRAKSLSSRANELKHQK
jgi:hypothetical protein